MQVKSAMHVTMELENGVCKFRMKKEVKHFKKTHYTDVYFVKTLQVE